MKAGIKEVARRAGVSPATVTRVLSGHPRVGIEISRKVQRAVAITGYQPNRMAKGLASHITGVIGVLIPGYGEDQLPHPYAMELVHSITAQARQQDFDILLGPLSYSDGKYGATEIKRLLRSRRVDGLIVLDSGRDGSTLFDGLDEVEDRVVLIGRNRQQHPIWSVDTDHAGVAYDATHHLISMGHTRIGLVCHSLEREDSSLRLKGYQRALHHHDFKGYAEWIVAREAWSPGAYCNEVSRLMQLQLRPTAMVITHDVVAWGILSALNELGFRVPEDMALVSLHNSQLAAMAIPSITSVDMGLDRLGRTAVDMLIRRIRGQYHEDGQSMVSWCVIPHRLIVRESSVIL